MNYRPRLHFAGWDGHPICRMGIGFHRSSKRLEVTGQLAQVTCPRCRRLIDEVTNRAHDESSPCHHPD